MPPGFPPGGFSYIYFFYYVWWGGEVWFAAARGAWRGRATRWRVGGYGWCGSAELLRYTGERGIMGAAAHPNTKNPTGRRGSFYSFL